MSAVRIVVPADGSEGIEVRGVFVNRAARW